MDLETFVNGYFLPMVLSCTSFDTDVEIWTIENWPDEPIFETNGLSIERVLKSSFVGQMALAVLARYHDSTGLDTDDVYEMMRVALKKRKRCNEC